MNDDFAKTLGNYEDMVDLRTKVREQLLRQRTAEAENKLNDAALAAVIAQANLVYPPSAVEETVHEMIEEARRNLTRSGYSLEDALRLQGLTLDQYHEQLHPQAEKRLQGRLVLAKMAELERIRVAPEEITAEIDRMAPPGDEQAAAFREALESGQGQLVVFQDVLTEKTLQRLRDIATGKAPELAVEAVGDQSQGVASPVESTAQAEPIGESAAPATSSRDEEPAEETTSSEA